MTGYYDDVREGLIPEDSLIHKDFKMLEQRIAKIITNEDGKLQYDLNEIEIYWLDKFEQLDDEQLSAVFVAWDIESTDRWARSMMEEE